MELKTAENEILGTSWHEKPGPGLHGFLSCDGWFVQRHVITTTVFTRSHDTQNPTVPVRRCMTTPWDGIIRVLVRQLEVDRTVVT